MEFKWGQNKSQECFTERGFDFAYVIRAFFDPNRLVQRDKRHDYGEKRYQLIGKIDERVFVVIYTPRKKAVRIISACKANIREVRHYHENTSRDY
ncbi:MAG: BrnT family toxin [Desulfovermiculus sp.]|nr:BrnT family toxin [Desulfovermiculus sp.]